MKCPNTTTCPDTDLVMTERQGVEIDYCPRCRGVWLDRGELDKLMDRAAAQAVPPASAARTASAPPGYAPTGHARRPDFEDSDYNPYRAAPGYQKRKKSWLSDIFD